MAISASNINKSLGMGGQRINILKNISLTINEGEVCAIVGASGSGKTTLLGVLAGMDAPDSGEVKLINDTNAYQGDIYAQNEEWRAALRSRQMGFVFQNFQLIPDMTAYDNVCLPLHLSGRGDLNVAKEWLSKVGLEHRLNHYPRQLSGGEQQRVALARAFANQPQILFADEPTGSLDESTAKTMIELLFELNRSAGSTLVLVTHDNALAERCDRIYQLRGGELLVNG